MWTRWLILISVNIIQESRISDNFPFCINGTQIEETIAENGCRGDFLLSSLDAHQGILETRLGDNVTMCREGSLPDIVYKIARQIVTVVGDCEWTSENLFLNKKGDDWDGDETRQLLQYTALPSNSDKELNSKAMILFIRIRMNFIFWHQLWNMW